MGNTLSATVCYGVDLGNDRDGYKGTVDDETLEDEYEFLEENGMEGVFYGSDGGLGHILAFKASMTEVEWHEVKPIDATFSHTGNAMETFCAKYGVKCEPRWLISALYF